MPESAYDRTRKERCEWCAKGFVPRVDGGRIHKIYPLKSTGEFKDTSVLGPFSQYFPCTASSLEAWAEELAGKHDMLTQMYVDQTRELIAASQRLERAREALRQIAFAIPVLVGDPSNRLVSLDQFCDLKSMAGDARIDAALSAEPEAGSG